MITARAITFTTPGPDLEKTVESTEFEIDESSLKDDELILEALATPINPSDILQVTGAYASAPVVQTLGDKKVSVGGNEGLFKVIHTGKSVSQYQVGDWVIPLMPSFGTWRTHAVVSTKENATPLVKLCSESDPLKLEEGANISINPCTAFQIMDMFIDDWSEGDWIIQNAGNSQVSKFLTQLAKLKKVNVISVVRKGKSKSDLDELYDLGATKVIDDEELISPKFQETLQGWTKGNRVRLALDSVGGEAVGALVQSLSVDGQLVTYGVSSGKPITYSSGQQLFKNISTHSYWLTRNTKKDPNYKIKTILEVLKLYRDGKLKCLSFDKAIYENSSEQDFKALFLSAVKASKSGKQVLVYK